MELSRKKRELLQREELILDVTRDLLLELGYHGLTMDRIAEAMEYSKGTIYQHFPCKEEVLAEVGTRLFRTRLEMFKRAAAFNGRTRERIVAIGEAGELFVRLHPDDFRLLHIIKAEIIARKVSEKRLRKMKDSEYAVLFLMNGIIREAIQDGDLDPACGKSIEEMSFGLWAVTDGGYGNIVRGMPLDEIGIKDPFRSVISVCEILGDGYGWRPLTSEWNYDATRERIRATLFAEETRTLARRTPRESTAG